MGMTQQQEDHLLEMRDQEELAETSPIKGMMWGLLLSVPIWAIIITGIIVFF